MASTYDFTESGTSVREALRALRTAPNFGDAAGLSIVTDSAPPLELAPADVTPPRLEPAAPIEGGALSALSVSGPVTGVAAFLDGIQRSRVFLTGPNGLPIVHGLAAAVIRRRSNRALHTWGGSPRVSRAVYAPLALLGPAAAAGLRTMRMEVVDTLTDADPPSVDHPALFLGLARHAVQERRETLERALAERWCAAEHEPLFVDGGLSGMRAAAASELLIGVVKSHRTLYSLPATLGVVTGLAAGFRTTAFQIDRRQRGIVASWYLRLRDAGGRDPFFGLVRVEVARETWTPARADEVSRWVLAERAPVSLPDPRWSTMAYGIRDCEEYLRAVVN